MMFTLCSRSFAAWFFKEENKSKQVGEGRGFRSLASESLWCSITAAAKTDLEDLSDSRNLMSR